MNIRGPVVAAALLVLAGCGDDGQRDLTARLDEMRSRPEGHIEPLPERPEYQPLRYRAGDERSPFEQGAIAAAPTLSQADAEPADSGPRPDPQRTREPLERFALEALQLTGTLTVNGRTMALIRTPEGELVRLYRGDYLGQNNGRVVAIDRSGIDIVELQPGGDGYSEVSRRMTMSGTGSDSGRNDIGYNNRS
ncbi:pilus assembly protein PilP [Kushneria aurantia]|uniref:Pilus assembly protein PilP n=1 Tax=Kushneria aurantia TaxID=504092 RepID=A0ABV6G020_9GAMM|nr:pilus assembly protein PilP [Kushneria aurantia]